MVIIKTKFTKEELGNAIVAGYIIQDDYRGNKDFYLLRDSNKDAINYLQCRYCFSFYRRSGEELLQNTILTSDGHSALQKCGKEKMKGWVNCVNHLIHHIGQHTCSPYKKTIEEFSKEDIEMLADGERLIKLAHQIVLTVKGNSKVANKLSMRPRPSVKTRWLTYLHGLADINKISLELLKFDQETDLFNNVNEFRISNGRILDLIAIFTKMERPSLYFEQENSIKLHKVIPVLMSLQKEFKEMMASMPTEFGKAIAKGAYISCTYNLKNMTAEVYLAAVLSPKGKLLQFEESVKNQIKECLDKWLAGNPRKESSFSQDICDNLFSDLDFDEFQFDEYSHYMNDTSGIHLPIELYWTTIKNIYPNLYVVAKHLLGSAASECVCEKSFSELKNIIDFNRINLEDSNVEKIMLAKLLLAIERKEDSEAIIEDDALDEHLEKSPSHDDFTLFDM